MLKVGFHSTSFGYYKDEIDGLNWSKLAPMRESAAACKAAMDNPRPSTASQDFGTAAHTFILEPQKFDDEVAVWQGTRRGKAWDNFKLRNENRLIITSSEHLILERMGNRFREHPLTKDINRNALVEQSGVWDVDGVRCKGRLDILWGNRVIDLKTTRHDNIEDFVRDAEKYGYLHQLAFYALGYEAITKTRVGSVGIIAATKVKDPRGPDSLFYMDLTRDELGDYMEACRCMIAEFAQCKETGYWPDNSFPDVSSPGTYDPNKPICLLTGELRA